MFLFSKNALNWLKVTVKTFIMLQKISISNKCCSFELSIHCESWKIKCITVSTNIFSSTTSQARHVTHIGCESRWIAENHAWSPDSPEASLTVGMLAVALQRLQYSPPAVPEPFSVPPACFSITRRPTPYNTHTHHLAFYLNYWQKV